MEVKTWVNTFKRCWMPCVCVCLLGCVRIFVTPWNVVRQTSLSMGFSRQGYYSGLLFPSPGDLPDPGIEPASPASPALAGGLFTSEPPGKCTECFGHLLSEIFKKGNRTTIYNSFYIEFACGKVILYKVSKMKCRNNYSIRFENLHQLFQMFVEVLKQDTLKFAWKF